MLTLKLLRENPEFVIAKLAKKNFDAREIVGKINLLDQNRRSLQLELDTCLAEQKKKVDVVFMDPPRAGSDEAFLSSVVKLAPKKVVYVSCNPETLARDLKYLTKHGYVAGECQPVDMFPFTKHTENVVALTRK